MPVRHGHTSLLKRSPEDVFDLSVQASKIFVRPAANCVENLSVDSQRIIFSDGHESPLLVTDGSRIENRQRRASPTRNQLQIAAQARSTLLAYSNHMIETALAGPSRGRSDIPETSSPRVQSASIFCTWIIPVFSKSLPVILTFFAANLSGVF